VDAAKITELSAAAVTKLTAAPMDGSELPLMCGSPDHWTPPGEWDAALLAGWW
jgi:hypothetical protein